MKKRIKWVLNLGLEYKICINADVVSASATLDIVQLVLNDCPMETKKATQVFEALTSEARLCIFRLLVKHAPDGLVAGELSRLADIPKTNLSFHLKTLVHSGLASVEREGRNTRYRANIPLMLETIGYLTAECCSGHPEQCSAYRRESCVDAAFLPTCCGGKTSDPESGHE